MLRLNPNDNQGIRYVLAECLMKSGDTEALKNFLKQYDEDGSALWLYTQALVAFRENEAGDGKAEELAKEAWKANSHVPAVLAGTKKAKLRQMDTSRWAVKTRRLTTSRNGASIGIPRRARPTG